MKTFIAVPSLEYVPALFTQSLAMLRRAGDTQVGFEVGSLVYVARNELARAAIKCEADQILWLDSDMVFTPDLLEKMQSVSKANDIDILTLSASGGSIRSRRRSSTSSHTTRRNRNATSRRSCQSRRSSSRSEAADLPAFSWGRTSL